MSDQPSPPLPFHEQTKLPLSHETVIVHLTEPATARFRMGREILPLLEARCTCGWAAMFTYRHNAEQAADDHKEEGRGGKSA